MNKVSKIISGGQTGADRAAFDVALEKGIEIGGFVPKGRLAENGRIPNRYCNLFETETPNPAERTELNVKNSDATLIVTQGSLKGGSLLTREFAEKHEKPFRHIDLSVLTSGQAVEKTVRWVNSNGCRTLNIAGPRASEEPQSYERTREFLRALFDQFLIV